MSSDRVVSGQVKLAGHDGSDMGCSKTKYKYVLDILILFPAFFVLASVRNDFGIAFASALLALSDVLTPTSIEEKLRKILEYFTAKTNSAQVDINIKMQPKKPSKRDYVYRYVLYFVIYIALWEVVLRAIGWIR